MTFTPAERRALAAADAVIDQPRPAPEHPAQRPTIYVDMLIHQGMVVRGRTVASCHMFCDSIDLEPLHALALRIGMKRTWLHAPRYGVPHYDLVPSVRSAAIAAGAVPIDDRRLWAGIYRPIRDRWRVVQGCAVPQTSVRGWPCGAPQKCHPDCPHQAACHDALRAVQACPVAPPPQPHVDAEPSDV